MRRLSGLVAELGLLAGEERALIACPAETIPAPGQYLLAAERGAIQATTLFHAGTWKQGFLVTRPFPSTWQPGTELTLFGPLGNGFRLPADVQRLALIALGDTSSRLLPLVSNLKMPQASITLFSDAQSTDLPPEVEAYPIQDLPASLDWADFFAVDSPMESLETLAALFNQPAQRSPGLRGQVLVQTNMPCCGLGKCGVCALRVKQAWKMSCEDGPVFDLPDVLKSSSW